MKTEKTKTKKTALQIISEAGFVERISTRYKFPETLRVQYTKKTKSAIVTELKNMRELKSNDKGVSLDLTNTTEINADAEKLILDIIHDVVKNNVIGIDVYVNENPSTQIKSLCDKIKQLSEAKKTNHIKIKIDKNQIVKNNDAMWPKVLFIIGVGLTVAGGFMRVAEISGAGIKAETNLVQIVGVVCAIIPALPFLSNFLKNIRRVKNDAKTN